MILFFNILTVNLQLNYVFKLLFKRMKETCTFISFYFLAKFYAINYFVFEIQKQDTDFSITFHYHFIITYLKLPYANADITIYRYIFP